MAGPPAVQDPQDPNKLINVCASAQPRHFRDFQILPGGAAGDPAKAKDSIGGNAHFNSGILNFAHFLFASGYTHSVGNQTIAPQTNNQGRLALGNILSRYPEKLGSALAQSVANSAPGGTPVPAIVQQMQDGNWTYDGAREAMIQAALDTYPNSSTPHELARSYDAVGIWRPENEVDMFGIDRVAMLPVTTPGAQQAAGPDGILYLVNYDGARRNVTTRCVKQMVGVSCGSPVDIDLPFLYQPNPPYGAPAAISMPDGTAAIIYPTASGQLAWQMFDENGPAVSQMIDDANTPQPTTLFGPTWPVDANGNVDSIRALGIGAAYTPPANGAQFGDGPWIAYLCADAACTCNGAAGLVANGAVICVRNAAGTNEKVIQTSIATADVRRDHSPALVLSNGVLTVIWVQPDVNLPVGVERVFYASRIDAANFFNWTVPQAWHTAGEAGLHDFPTFTHSAIAAASLPGAGVGPLDEPQDRVYLQYKPEIVGLGSQLPNNEAANAQANYDAASGGGRAYCFASGVFGAGATLAKQSMGVGQNRDGVSVLEGAPAATQGSLGAGAIAGGFVNWAGRTYAAIRVTSTGGQPTGPAYYWDHSVNPLYYGPLLLRSVGWR